VALTKSYQLKTIVILSLVISSVIGCSSETKPLEFKPVEIKSDFKSNISGLYEVAEGNDAISSKLNSQIQSTIIDMIGIDTTAADLGTALRAFDKTYTDFIKDFPDASEPKWELQVETEKTYQSEDVITIAISVYRFEGGAHGNDEIRLLNINPKTGEMLPPEAIIEDLKEFESLAKSHFIKNLKRKGEDLSIEDYFFGDSFHLPENMGFSEDGFILLYNVYEIASYAQGYTEFAIPYDEMDPYLKLF
jgi:hypothetical protein